MSSEKIQRVGIIGAGQMGAGIAEVWAPAPGDVVVVEQTPEQAPAVAPTVQDLVELGTAKLGRGDTPVGAAGGTE